MNSRKLYYVSGGIVVGGIVFAAVYFLLMAASMAGYRPSIGGDWLPTMVPRTSHNREKIEFEGIRSEYDLTGSDKESQQVLAIEFEKAKEMQFTLQLGEYPQLELNGLKLADFQNWPGNEVVRTRVTLGGVEERIGLGHGFSFDKQGKLRKFTLLWDSPSVLFLRQGEKSVRIWKCSRQQLIDVLGPPKSRTTIGVKAAPNH